MKSHPFSRLDSHACCVTSVCEELRECSGKVIRIVFGQQIAAYTFFNECLDLE